MKSIDYTDCNLIFIVRKEHINEFGIDAYLKNKFGDDVITVVAEKLTDGAVCSCLLAEKYINNELPLLIHCSDIYFEKRLNPNTIDANADGCILTFKSNSPNYSYSEIGQDGYVLRTQEKTVISNLASVGLYYFKSGSLFVKYAKTMIDRNIRTNNEFFICPLYNLLIEDGLKITTKKVEKMHIFGTPEEFDFFTKNSLKSWKDNKKIAAVCSDHSGFEAKEIFKKILTDAGLNYIDFGTFNENDTDYSEYVKISCKSILEQKCDFGFGFCRSGQGVNICANKIQGIRSALVMDSYFAEYAVRHNCANFFSIPSKYLNSEAQLQEILCAVLNNTFDGGRHQARLQKV
jgi:RpiB/LacA/LacB family sugar-phosphate isomerase